jgi:hypothetical protein
MYGGYEKVFLSEFAELIRSEKQAATIPAREKGTFFFLVTVTDGLRRVSRQRGRCLFGQSTSRRSGLPVQMPLSYD